jgi:hypothetical protein
MDIDIAPTAEGVIVDLYPLAVPVLMDIKMQLILPVKGFHMEFENMYSVQLQRLQQIEGRYPLDMISVVPFPLPALAVSPFADSYRRGNKHCRYDNSCSH